MEYVYVFYCWTQGRLIFPVLTPPTAFCAGYAGSQNTPPLLFQCLEFHGDESKPEIIGALFKPLYRGNILTYELLII